MSFIPFNQIKNRLCITQKQVDACPQLLDFFQYHNSRRPGTFDYDNKTKCWWFYPPEDYVMPAIEPQLPVVVRK